MHLYLPERIYRYLCATTAPLSLMKECNALFDGAKSFVEYTKKTRYFDNPQKALRQIAELRSLLIDKPNYQRELRMLFFFTGMVEQCPAEEIEQDSDPENVLMYYYFYSVQKDDEHRVKYQNKFLDFFYKHKDFDDYSDRIYIKVLQYLWEEKRELYLKRVSEGEEDPYQLFSEYMKFVHNTYGECLEKHRYLNNDSFIQAMLHKMTGEYFYWLMRGSTTFISRYPKEVIITMMEKMEKDIEGMDHKYSNFNYYIFMSYHHMYMNYFDLRDFKNAARILEKIINLINYSYENFDQSVKALTHHNFHFEIDYMIMACQYAMMEKFLPSMPCKINKNNIPEADRPFFEEDGELDESLLGKRSLNQIRDIHKLYFIYTEETYKEFDNWIKDNNAKKEGIANEKRTKNDA